MASNTIKDVVIQILEKEKAGLSPSEIYNKIIGQNLYEFKSKTPISIINGVLRKACEGVELKKSNEKKIFKRLDNGSYTLK